VSTRHIPAETCVKKLRERQPVRRNINLLATIQEAGSAAKSFGNIIELGSRALIIETNRELEAGTSITVKVVFPGQPRGKDPFAHLRCSVRKVQDDPKLHYDLTIVDMDSNTRERLEIYLAQSSAGRGF
jgi:hypothetical protein